MIVKKVYLRDIAVEFDWNQFKVSTYFDANTALTHSARDIPEGCSYVSECGYSDSWTYLLERDFLHTWLMQKLGYPHSPYFEWMVFNSMDYITPEIRIKFAREKFIVSEFQKVMNSKPNKVTDHESFSTKSISELRKEAWEILRMPKPIEN